MSLTLTHLSFQNFRNYETFTLDDIQRVMVFIGPNAIGKSNIIEGIQLLTALTTFKHALTNELIKEGSNEAFLHSVLKDEKRELSLSLHIQEKKKTYSLNGKRKKNGELKTLLPAVVFTPDDLDLVKGSHTKRRTTLDELGCQVSDAYSAVKKDFETILKQKNSLLKDEAAPVMLESINDVFLTCATQLTYYRIHLFQKFLPYIVRIYSNLTQDKESLTLSYLPSWEDEETISLENYGDLQRDDIRQKLEEALQKRESEEFIRKRALVGPQADKLTFYIDNKPAQQYGSQGQQRTVVLAWKLAEIELIEEMLQQKPILLLDDVMSELDVNRREALSQSVKEATQVFITTTNIDYFSPEFLHEVTPIYLPK